MLYSRITLIIIYLLFTCLFSACQTLPTSEENQAIEHSPVEYSADQHTAEPLEVKLPELITSSEVSETVISDPVEIPAMPVPSDVWERMRAGFRLKASSRPKVKREVNWYAKHPGYIARIQDRASPYIYFILEELEKRDMPTELALLPVVESAYQPFAYSPGRAAGIWQFIPSTGRLYGLKQNWWYDGRRDILLSTRAALDYLKRLNQQFDGDWELALAAYNSGAGTVSRAIRKNKKSGKSTDFWSLRLPKETRTYVPRLLAISQIFSNPEEYGISLKTFPDEPYFETVAIQSQLDLALAAEMSDLSIQELYQLNSGFNRWATDPDGPHQLHLPLDKVDGFRQKLAQLPEDKRLSWKRYKIKTGDSLSRIAKNHGTTTKTLKQVNKLPSSRIRAGKHLLIPVSSKQLNHYTLSAEQRKAKTQKQLHKGTKQHYIVKNGDSLWHIAQGHGVSHKQLAKWNGIVPRDPIRPGQKLVIWRIKPATTSLSALDIQPDGIQSSVSYKVKQGDSLSRIAQRFSVSIADLRKWNTLPGKYLQPGQNIKLYVDVTEQTL